MNPNALSAQSLAYLGDAVFELCVRSMLLSDGGYGSGEMNRLARQYVSAGAQAAMAHAIIDALTDEERAVLKRGRNAHPTAKAKHASMVDYRYATGLEALFGFLYQAGRYDRIAAIFALCVEARKLT